MRLSKECVEGEEGNGYHLHAHGCGPCVVSHLGRLAQLVRARH